MLPLTVDDLLPVHEYASRRREFFDSHRRYLDRYRRAPIGPHITLVFENRQTLWFRLQEVIRVARLADPTRLHQELELYNRLLPQRGRLQAALMIHVGDDTNAEDLASWEQLQGDQLCFCLGPARYPALLLTCRPEDRCFGAAYWVELALDSPGRTRLADFKQPAFFELATPATCHKSPRISDEMRQSLLEDLALSDRDN